LVADAALAGRYGTFSFNSRNGNWSYTQGDTSAQAAHVQALNTGEVGVDELEVSSLDGTASVTIRVKVNGLDEPKVDLPQKKEQTVEAPKTIPDNKPIVELPKTTFTISMDQFNTSRTQTITGFNENSVLDVPNELNYRGAKVVSNDLDLSFKQGNDAYAVILVGVTSIDDTTKDGTPSQIV